MRMIPEAPPAWCSSKAERQLFEWFRSSKDTDGWIAMHSVRVQGSHRYKRMTELDFLLLTPLGVLVIEVKGGRVRQQGYRRWFYQDGVGRITAKHEGPFEQAEGGLHALETWLRKQPETAKLGSMLLTGWGVAMPDMPSMDWGAGVDPRQVYDLTDRGRSVREVIIHMLGVAAHVSRAQSRRPPTLAECELIARELLGDSISIPELDLGRRIAAGALEARHERIFEGLDTWGHYPRLMIHTPAGTASAGLVAEVVRRRASSQGVVGLLAPQAHIEPVCEALGSLGVSVIVLEEQSSQVELDVLVVYQAHAASQEQLADAMMQLDGGTMDGAWVVMHDARNLANSVDPGVMALLDKWGAMAEVQTLVHNVCHTKGITHFVNTVCDPALRLNSKVTGPAVQLSPVTCKGWCAKAIEASLEQVLIDGGVPARHLMVLVAENRQREPVELLIRNRGFEVTVRTIVDAEEMMADVVLLIGIERIAPPQWRDLIYLGVSCARYMAILHIGEQGMTDYVTITSAAWAVR